MGIENGEVFGRLIATGESEFRQCKGQRRRFCECLCECETVTYVRLDKLRSGNTQSCGCLNRELYAERGKANTRHGECKTRKYKVWNRMRNRCNNKRNKRFKDYGGRGIKVCEEWQSYEVFSKWADENGYSDELTIDRIDNDGDYTPENCRWSTYKEQQNNKRNNVILSAFGETKTLSQWTEDERCAVGYNTLRDRIRTNRWDLETAITTPPTQ